MPKLPPILALTAVSALLLSGCQLFQDNKKSEGDQALRVTSTADACKLSATKAPAGTLTFKVKNEGDQITEFYLLGEDKLRVVGEVENVGPGITRDLVVTAPEGKYYTACKPGMKGEGIRAAFTVEKSDKQVNAKGSNKELVDQANKNYQAYVQDQSAQLLVKTEEFVKAYKGGQDDKARQLYPVARTHWERIEPVAESFGDLDPMVDAREADLEPGQKWTGWHVIEKDLWPQRAKNYQPLTKAQRTQYADGLLANTKTLDGRVQKLTYTVDQIANGARGLLDEVAKTKVTGEEEHWSRTDFYDFQANVDGARVAFAGIKPIVAAKDPELASLTQRRFDELQKLLDAQREGDGFKSYDQATPAQIKAFSDAVNALSEPLSKLTAAVI